MSNFFGYSPWTDAAAYGTAGANTLAQALIGLPQQRAELALERGQILQRGQQNQLMYQLQKDKINNQTLSIQNRNDYQDMANRIRLLQAQIEAQKAGNMPTGRVEDGYWVPNGGQPLGLGQPQWNPNAGVNSLMGLPEPQQPQMGGQMPQQGLPGGVIPLPKPANTPLQRPATQGQEVADKLKGLSLWGQFMAQGATNNASPYAWGRDQASNLVVNPYPQQQMPQQQSFPTVRDRKTGQTFTYKGNVADVPTNQYDILQ